MCFDLCYFSQNVRTFPSEGVTCTTALKNFRSRYIFEHKMCEWEVYFLSPYTIYKGTYGKHRKLILRETFTFCTVSCSKDNFLPEGICGIIHRLTYRSHSIRTWSSFAVREGVKYCYSWMLRFTAQWKDMYLYYRLPHTSLTTYIKGLGKK